MNSVNMTGRIVADPEIKKVNVNNEEKSVCGFTIAVQKNKDQADFFHCVVWERQAENLGKYVSKGDLIGVSGSLSTRSYEHKDGYRVYITEIKCFTIDYLNTKGKENTQGQSQSTTQNQSTNTPQTTSTTDTGVIKGSSSNETNIDIDDLPW